MKTRLLIILLTLAFSPVQKIMAYHSELTIRMQNNRYFMLQINNTRYTESNYYHVRNLAPGSHHIRVYEYTYSQYGYGSQAVSYVLRFSGYLNIPAGHRVNAIIDMYNQLFIENSHPISVVLPAPDRPNYHKHNRPPRNRAHRQVYGMPSGTYEHLLSVLHNSSFDNNRLNIAKQAVAANSCTAIQVLGIMRTFSFESNRLNFAKFAFSHCVDKENYFMVHDGFSFSSSKRELMRYTGSAY